MESIWSVANLSTESVGNRSALVANNCVHTADADATQLDSCVASASAVCIWHYILSFYCTMLRDKDDNDDDV